MTDTQFRQDIIDELEFDPSFNGEHIGVVVEKNVVTLTGHVNSYAEKLAAIAAVAASKASMPSPRTSKYVTPTRTRPLTIRSPSGRSTSLVGMFTSLPAP